MLIYNYHTHTSRCGHACGNDEEYVLAAIKAGYKILGFSDHAPYKDYSLPNSRMDYQYLDDYIQSISALKKKYKDQIEIHLGLESEFYPENIAERRELLDKVDYEIRFYAQSVCMGLESGLFSYLCHPDVFMNRQEAFTPVCEEVAHMIAQKCVETNTPVELNVRGVMKGRKHFPSGEKYYYPHYDFWKILSAYPLKVTVGIDAHDPADLLDLKAIDDALKEVEDFHLNIITEPFIGK